LFRHSKEYIDTHTHTHTHTHTQEGDLTHLLLFLKIRKSRLKRTAVLTAVESLFPGRAIHVHSANEFLVDAQKEDVANE
jgi:hypothetical protein